jgi:hypothetical protein
LKNACPTWVNRTDFAVSHAMSAIATSDMATLDAIGFAGIPLM